VCWLVSIVWDPKSVPKNMTTNQTLFVIYTRDGQIKVNRGPILGTLTSSGPAHRNQNKGLLKITIFYLQITLK